ncbi:MAG: putative manganese transporter [Lachnospiraceae bacterium]|nr:putative manganese transporter [Lachnospiraceae bacterium]
MILDIFLDALMDCLRDLPFLFAAFLLVEALEHHVSEGMNRALAEAGGLGPLAGALLGCVPQCGFSIMAANLYAGDVIGLGTLLAVFLSTSDEALIILLSNPEKIKDVGALLLCKIVIGITAGYAIAAAEFLYRKKNNIVTRERHKNYDHNECHVEEGGILKPALRHTAEVIIFLFIVTFILNLLLELIGMENVSRMLLADTVFQPVLSSFIGLIPNCAASVILTQLYIDGVISFGSTIAGLCSSAGLGLLVLYRVNKNIRENVGITALLLVISAAAGMILQAIG